MLQVAVKNVSSFLFYISAGVDGLVYGKRAQKKGMHLEKKVGPDVWQTFFLPKHRKDVTAL